VFQLDSQFSHLAWDPDRPQPGGLGDIAYHGSADLKKTIASSYNRSRRGRVVALARVCSSSIPMASSSTPPSTIFLLVATS